MDRRQPADADVDQRSVDIGHATTTFSVTPSNAAGNGNTASVTVNVAGTSLGNCGQYSNVLPVVNVTWGQAANWQSTASGNFGDGNSTVWVFKLVVPPGTPATPSSNIGRFTVSEFNGPTTFRQMTISSDGVRLPEKGLSRRRRVPSQCRTARPPALVRRSERRNS